MATFAATIRLNVVYHAADSELLSSGRAQALAEAITRVVRDSMSIRVIEVSCEQVGDVERLDEPRS